jgi:hypothetical protein
MPEWCIRQCKSRLRTQWLGKARGALRRRHKQPAGSVVCGRNPEIPHVSAGRAGDRRAGRTGAYSATGVGPNRPSVGAPAAAARCISPESLPTYSAARARHAAASGRLRQPARSMASGRAARSGAAIARSASPGPASTAGMAPGRGPDRSAWNRAAKRSAGQVFGAQLAVGPRATTGASPGNSAAARARSAGAVQATGSGGGSRPSTAPSSAIFGPGRRRHTARPRVGTIQVSAVPRMSTTRSHSVVTTRAQSGGQCMP